MGKRPSPKHSIDRINGNGNYEPSNCRWATIGEQNRNNSRNKLNYDKALDIAKRMLAGEKARTLANEYGTSESLPREIHKGRVWKDAYKEARNR